MYFHLYSPNSNNVPEKLGFFSILLVYLLYDLSRNHSKMCPFHFYG